MKKIKKTNPTVSFFSFGRFSAGSYFKMDYRLNSVGYVSNIIRHFHYFHKFYSLFRLIFRIIFYCKRFHKNFILFSIFFINCLFRRVGGRTSQTSKRFLSFAVPPGDIMKTFSVKLVLTNLIS